MICALGVDHLAPFRSQHWKANVKGGSLPGPAVNTDRALMFLHDPVDDRQAETCALTRSLGGEERFEDPAQSLCFHAVPRVTHRQSHMRPRAQVGMGRHEMSIRLERFQRTSRRPTLSRMA